MRGLWGVRRGLNWLGALVLVFSACAGISDVASALAVDRGYEMVSPPYKAGYPVSEELLAVAPEGNRVAFSSQGGFDGELSPGGSGLSTYMAIRSAAGWATTAEMPSPFGGVIDFSANLSDALGKKCPSSNAGAQQYNCTDEQYLLHPTSAPDTPEEWELAGTTLTPIDDGESITLEEGASAELCHIVVGVGNNANPLLPEAERADNPLYDVNASPANNCASKGQPLKLVPVKNTLGPHGEPEIIERHCASGLGVNFNFATSTNGPNAFNSVASQGEELFFSTGVENQCGAKLQLFARMSGERTIEISRPLTESCEPSTQLPCPEAALRANAYFKGASEDGSRVFLTTTASLVKESPEPPEGNDLYMAVIGCPEGEPSCSVAQRQVTSLVLVSRDPVEKQAASVQGVVRVAPNGSHVYFVARSDLLQQQEEEALERERQPVPRQSADNLYAYDVQTAKTSFIADLCSGPKVSGEAEDLHCPRNLPGGVSGGNDTALWTRAVTEAQVNVCERDGPGECAGSETGRFLLFTSYGQLEPDDTNEAQDVYRYDAQDQQLKRVSTGEAGYDANGNGVGVAHIALSELSANAVYRQHELATRAISEDGSQVVFMADRFLSPLVSNGNTNIYEWSEGTVSLISTGNSATQDVNPVISPLGHDIYFMTEQGLVPQDTDGLYDIYDARVGGGFPEPPSQPQPCASDACQGPLTNPAPLLVPGSVSQAPGENLPPVKIKIVTKKKPKKSLPTKKKHKKRGHVGRKASGHGRRKLAGGGGARS
jgi:hypothetical protein